jgi:hypothetical protein
MGNFALGHLYWRLLFVIQLKFLALSGISGHFAERKGTSSALARLLLYATVVIAENTFTMLSLPAWAIIRKQVSQGSDWVFRRFAFHFRVGIELVLGQEFVFKYTYFYDFGCLGAETNEPGWVSRKYLLYLDDLFFYYRGYYQQFLAVGVVCLDLSKTCEQTGTGIDLNLVLSLLFMQA